MKIIATLLSAAKHPEFNGTVVGGLFYTWVT